MYNPYGDEPRLNAFLLISVVLHAIIFFALPNLDAFLDSDVPGMAGGGVIQIMHVETTVNPRPSPVTDRLSQSTVPKVTEPRPIPQVEPEKVAVAQPEIPKVEQPKVEQAKPAVPEPDPEPVVPAQPVEPEPVVEVPQEEGRGEVLTSPAGQEVAVEPEKNQELVTPPVQPRPEPETKPPVQSSGSGEGTEGADDEGGMSQSGEGSALTAPPPPPPPPSGRSLHLGGGSPTYPKNAEHDGLEGRVLITLEVAAHGELQSIVLKRSSGHELLDLQALRYIESLWSFKPMDYDYTMDVEVIYTKEDNRFTTSLNYGEVRWLNLP